MDKSIFDRLDKLEQQVSAEEWVADLERRVGRLAKKKAEKPSTNKTHHLKRPLIFISVLCAIGSIACAIWVYLLTLH